MKKFPILLLFTLIFQFASAQKKPLDHSVYDGWQYVGSPMISDNGKWIVYSVNVQEGDNELVVQSADLQYKKIIPRASSPRITLDNRYLVFRIEPTFKQYREAKIKKKRPDDMPKDSLGVLALGTDSIWKKARVKSYEVPEESFGWIAYQMEKPAPSPSKKSSSPDVKKITDSLNRIIDSLVYLVENPPTKKKRNRDGEELNDAEGDESSPAGSNAGTELVLRKTSTGEQIIFSNVLEYAFDKKGTKLVIEKAREGKDSTSKNLVLLMDLQKGYADTISRGGNDFRSFAFSDDGTKLAFVAERDATSSKTLQKYYKLWYYSEGMDSAIMMVDKNAPGIQVGMTVSEHSRVQFSKSGKRLFFGAAPILPPKDTSLIEIDQVKVDIWHYNDDYLQTRQLSLLNRDLQQNYLAMVDLENNSITQLGSIELPIVYTTNEGDGETFVGVTDYGNRIEEQWVGRTRKSVYAINPINGMATLVKKNADLFISPSMLSPTGKYIVWYEPKPKQYMIYDGEKVRTLTSGIKYPLYNEENDLPNDPSPYGTMGWHEGDSAVYVYDRYDVWKLDPDGKQKPQLLNPISGRSSKTRFRYVRTDPEERFISCKTVMLFRTFNERDKTSGYWLNKHLRDGEASDLPILAQANVSNGVFRAKNGEGYLFASETYTKSPDLYFCKDPNDFLNATKLSSLNPQQADYNWGTAELYKWKAFDGKMAEGILYKPEDFNPAKKYPVIFYFYERHSDNLYDYIPPTPTGSRLNISFYVSRGYIVFSPDIRYTIGHPAKSAYNYVVSAARDLAKKKWVDADNMAIQGQSWGGIQVAQLITMTDMFKAAWAGAPVANMTSAYGGIRWGSGMNRQFQYEKTQSRIGATLWEKPQLYIENSPLFHLPKVKTPLVIMHNDADGAVPWYQGIELFTGLRRLGKKVWLLNYNGENHNLVERKNKKDIQIRQQQFFDYMLKGEPPARWITEGVPATMKGKENGLEF